MDYKIRVNILERTVEVYVKPFSLYGIYRTFKWNDRIGLEVALRSAVEWIEQENEVEAYVASTLKSMTPLIKKYL